jgi:hypothetical protein
LGERGAQHVAIFSLLATAAARPPLCRSLVSFQISNHLSQTV